MLSLAMDDQRKTWDDRASRYGSNRRGVLFQNLPEVLNESLHCWHSHIIDTLLQPRLNKESTVLDLGCGYGRLSEVLKKNNPQIDLFGCDLSEVYCQRYRAQWGVSACARIERLPFANGSFDAIVAVTVLMYVAPSERATVLGKLAMLLRPGGYLLLVDPGEEFMEMVKNISPRVSARSSGGHGFRQNTIESLASDAGLSITAKGANPFITLGLPAVIPLIPALPNIAKALLRLQLWLDRKAGWNAGLALHRYTLLKSSIL